MMWLSPGGPFQGYDAHDCNIVNMPFDFDILFKKVFYINTNKLIYTEGYLMHHTETVLPVFAASSSFHFCFVDFSFQCYITGIFY